jgi:hypothetical protein
MQSNKNAEQQKCRATKMQSNKNAELKRKLDAAESENKKNSDAKEKLIRLHERWINFAAHFGPDIKEESRTIVRTRMTRRARYTCIAIFGYSAHMGHLRGAHGHPCVASRTCEHGQLGSHIILYKTQCITVKMHMSPAIVFAQLKLIVVFIAPTHSNARAYIWSHSSMNAESMQYLGGSHGFLILAIVGRDVQVLERSAYER